MPSARYVWIDHELRDSSEATIPFLNAGLQASEISRMAFLRARVWCGSCQNMSAKEQV